MKIPVRNPNHSTAQGVLPGGIPTISEKDIKQAIEDKEQEIENHNEVVRVAQKVIQQKSIELHMMRQFLSHYPYQIPKE